MPILIVGQNKLRGDMMRYTIGEASKILGVTPQSLRNWQVEGKLIPDYMSDKGTRYYSETTILNFKRGENKLRKNVIYYCGSVSEYTLNKLKGNVRFDSEFYDKEDSGLDRKNWNSLMMLVDKGDIKNIYVLDKNNFYRYYKDWINIFIESKGSKIVELSEVL